MKTGDPQLIEWNERLSTGVGLIDLQHRVLFRMTNDLFTACLYGREIVEAYFNAAARRLLNYARRHFADEETLMGQTGYPQAGEHRERHREFLRESLRYVGRFEAGEPGIPLLFVRFLRRWIFSHVAVTDKKYGRYHAQETGAGPIPRF